MGKVELQFRWQVTFCGDNIHSQMPVRTKEYKFQKRDAFAPFFPIEIHATIDKEKKNQPQSTHRKKRRLTSRLLQFVAHLLSIRRTRLG
jgi:bifunctional DNase/RNase